MNYARSLAATAILSVVASLPIIRTASAQQPDQAKIDAGEAVYNNNCLNCHGERLVNSSQTTFDLRRLTAADRPRFENSVRNGKNQMPPWKDVLSAEEIDQLWAYIRANAAQN